MKKQKTALVLVEAISMFRMRYLVEVPANHPEYALDTVVMQEAKEFSQRHLDETIVSHRVVSEKEALALCDSDNDYTKSWTTEKKKEVFYTQWKEKNDNSKN